MKLKDLVLNDWFKGIMDGVREEFECNEEGKIKLQSILNLDIASLDNNILMFINRFENVVDEYQESELTDQIRSWFFGKAKSKQLLLEAPNYKGLLIIRNQQPSSDTHYRPLCTFGLFEAMNDLPSFGYP